VSQFVLDACVALAWFIDNPVAHYALEVKKAMAKDSRAIVPALWHLEMANGLAMAERRNLLTGAEITECIINVDRFSSQIETHNDFVPARKALSTARSFGLSAYDGVYLDLASRSGTPLATLDQNLRKAAGRAAVPIFLSHRST
jgi:predicted nucleic acid-binding protein